MVSNFKFMYLDMMEILINHMIENFLILCTTQERKENVIYSLILEHEDKQSVVLMKDILNF